MTNQFKLQDKQWCTYILRRIQPVTAPTSGQGNRLFYVGITNRLPERLLSHNTGKSKATRGFQWLLEAYLPMQSKSNAARVEQWLKNGNTRSKRERAILAFESNDASVISEYTVEAARWQARRAINLATPQQLEGAK